MNQLGPLSSPLNENGSTNLADSGGIFLSAWIAAFGAQQKPSLPRAASGVAPKRDLPGVEGERLRRVATSLRRDGQPTARSPPITDVRVTSFQRLPHPIQNRGLDNRMVCLRPALIGAWPLEMC